MNPAKFEQARRVFEAASSLSEVESRELVMKQCAADAELSEIVVDLLKQARRQLAEQVERAKRSNERGSSIIGARVGPYVVQSLIGQGGMGAVYEALHERTRQTVALKLLLAAVATPERLRRFEFEQQVLARLEHPGIARILHADTADLGGGVQPYFAMELVRGESLIDYSRSHNLTILQRLNLIVRVADALHYAHQRGVIHRDLKPSNIVVNECGEPKILDFGIARLSADGARSAIVSTQIGQLVGTLPYMSPEQASGDADLVDVRSDIYSLGVVAYELLSDRLPLDVRRLWIADAVQKIREEEPPRLGGISRAFRGDIDTIVRKALAKNKEHRYASANEFAADIRRHLNHEPITARRPTLGYQVDRFVKRHKAFTSSIVAVFFILSIGLVYSLYMLGRVRAAELREREWREAAQGALTQARQGEAWREATRRTNMEHIRVIQTLPTDEAGLNSAKRAFRMIKESGLDDAGLLMWAAEVLGRKMYDAKRVPEAADFWEKAVGIARTSVAPTDPIRITLLNNLVQCLSETNQHDRAIPLTIELIDVKRTVGRDCDQVFATNLNNLGRMLFWRRRAAEAEPYLREALELHRLLRPPPHVEVTNATWKYAAVLCELGRLQEGEELLRSMMDQVGETGVDRSRYWGTVQKMIEAALYSPVGDAELLPSATIAFWVEAFARSGETPIEP